MKLIYPPEAVQGLVRLRQFVAEKDPPAAARIAAELVGQLPASPEMGKPLPRSAKPSTVRDFVFGSYMRDMVHPPALAILRIWHQLEHQRMQHLTASFNPTPLHSAARIRF